VTKRHLQRWLDAWGYLDAPGALHTAPDEVPAEHIYRREICGLLDPGGAVRAQAVFDVDGVPAVCFLDADGIRDDVGALDAIRERIWNQNLISIVLTVGPDQATALPVVSRSLPVETLEFAHATASGSFSRADVQSGDVFIARPDWFAAEGRVDRVLLESLQVMVRELEGHGLSKIDAQLLMAQVMFVSYLEHRGIAGETYRHRHGVESLLTLVGRGDVAGISKLLDRLKTDFNGDLLEPGAKAHEFWKKLPAAAISRLHAFLRRVDLVSGQQDFWKYDFRFIPVELISGIYESFLADDKRDLGAYYTPRHLAMLVVDLALSKSTNLLSERIFDGACGSGILLTTAYRRLLGKAEAQAGRTLDFTERVDMLKSSIFGSDLNLSACRVTAFSLYLSVLEGLDPSDLAVLTAKGSSLLPKLVGQNLRGGAEGDFFSDANPRFQIPDCSIFLSNPPWVEPKKTVVLSSDIWAQAQGFDIPRRQTAGAFVLRALDCVAPSATLCFILPVSILAAPSSRAFVRDVLARYEIQSLINFGDVRKLLFAAARQPCVVMVARPRPADQWAPAPTETIDYWVPKADISLAFGRLTLHGSDRHRLRAQSLAHSNELLTTLFWGNAHDAGLLAKLRAGGTLGHFLNATPGWDSRKGFHAKDSSVEVPTPSRPLWKLPYLDAKAFAFHGPVLDPGILASFPKDKLPTVARLPTAVMDAFTGPRIVITDGMTTRREVCAAFSSTPFSFKSSIGAIVAPPGQEDLLRFLALYLHSDLARYGLLLTAFQVAFERERVSLKDLGALPFIAPDKHTDPARAWAIVREVSRRLHTLERTPSLARQDQYDQWKPEAQALIAEYFGLTPAQTIRIREVVDLVLDSVQPGAFSTLHTPLQHRPTQAAVQAYARALVHELSEWRDAMGGQGRIQAELIVNERPAHGALGILRLSPTPATGAGPALGMQRSDAAVRAVIALLQQQRRLPAPMGENLYLASDMVVRLEDNLYLIKPLLCRFWLVGEALRDAERIVRAAQSEVR
jgi:hypothetical protein